MDGLRRRVFMATNPMAKPIFASPNPPEDFLLAINELEQIVESRILVFFLSREIERPLVDKFYEQRELFKGLQDVTVLIDCGGGSIDAAYQIVRFLRHHCKKIRVLVPRWAKSAATFICLGSDEIIMSEVAELGPLDAQLTDPRNPLKTMSALDGFKALEALRKFSMESFDLMTISLIERIREMPLKDMMAEADNFVTRLATPVFAKFEPLDLGAYSQALKLGEEYLKRVIPLTSHGRSRRKGQQEVIDDVIWKYPSHTFVIDYAEAKRLGLSVRLLKEEESRVVQKIMPHCMTPLCYVGFVDVPKKNGNGNAKQEAAEAKQQAS